MPKPLVSKTMNTENSLSGINTQDKFRSKSPNTEAMFRKKRSPGYMEAMRQLDLHGSQLSKDKLDELVSIIKNEFPDVSMSDELLGIVSKCYLGGTYDVHTLDIMGNIVIHYNFLDPLPVMLEKARKLAKSGQYDFIEVYMDCIRAVSADGSVAVSK